MRGTGLFLVSLSAVVGCGSDPVETPTPPEGPAVYVAGEISEGVGVHGVGGDTRLLFNVQPAHAGGHEPQVIVASRETGDKIGSVAPPPDGWKTPLSIYIEHFEADGDGVKGTFLLSDAGGSPALAGLLTTRLYRYDYAYHPSSGLETTWRETHALPKPSGPPDPAVPPTGIAYLGGFAEMPDGSVVATDTLFGTIWASGPDLEGWTLVMADADFAFGTSGPVKGIGRAPGGGTRSYDMQVPGPSADAGYYPGIHSITYAELTDEVCTLRTASPGGIWCIDRSTLLDGTIAPPDKAAMKRVVVPPTPGLSDLTDGIVFDRYRPDSTWLYWQRSIADEVGGGSNTMRRVSLVSGAVEEVASSNEVFDFANNIAALPPIGDGGNTTIFVSMGQEENNPDVNVLLEGEEAFVSPTLMTIVEVAP